MSLDMNTNMKGSLRILQLLNWPLEEVGRQAKVIRSQGFDAVQLNPVQPLKEDHFDAWWLSYQPCGFNIGNQYGSKEALIETSKRLHDEDLLVFPDVICTHVAGVNDGNLVPHSKVDPKLANNPYFWREAKRINNWDSRYEAVNYCAGLPSFDLQNWDLQNIIIDFLNELIDCGADGFRFDSAKSIKTPQEGCDFFPRVLGSLKKNVYNYGEVIFADEELISLYAEYLDVLTNTWSRNRDHVVAFSESHDSYYEFGYTCNKTSREVTQDYSHVISEFPKSIYFTRSFDDEWKSEEVRRIHMDNDCKMLQKT